MIKPDVIVSWPNNCDYPLWRRFISENQNKFQKIIIVFTETNQFPRYDEFVKERLQGFCDIVYSPKIMPGQDWRDIAVNYGLMRSSNMWVWFTEQDFLPKEGFWGNVEKQMNEGCDAISYYDSYRMHPCCIFAKKNIINQTSRNFGILPGIKDHFGIFQDEVDELFYKGNAILGILDEILCDHMNGLSSNWTLITNGQQPNYKPERFKKYIQDCLNSGMKLDLKFEEICKNFLNE